MTLENIIETIKTIKNGTFTVLNYQSETVKGGNNYLKVTTMVVRIGVEYKNTKYAINKDTSGELKGKVWYLYKYILEGKTDYLLRVYPSNNPHHRAKSKYYCNGKEITKEEYNKALNKKSSSNPIPCFDVKIKNVISLG
jgi:hypothetical protein